MPNRFAVIGEHDEDPDRLLVVDEEGEHYAWELTTDTTVPIEVDDAWTVDEDVPDPAELLEAEDPG